MTCVGRKAGPGTADLVADCQRLLGPVGTVRRRAEIAALPQVTWKGRALVTLRCHGTSGKGPHDVNVPEVQVWSLINPSTWLCPYHAGDAWGNGAPIEASP